MFLASEPLIAVHQVDGQLHWIVAVMGKIHLTPYIHFSMV
jgi:hypothetical protein